jgi:hypothetical protein
MLKSRRKRQKRRPTTKVGVRWEPRIATQVIATTSAANSPKRQGIRWGLLSSCLAAALTVVVLFKHDTTAWTITLLAILWISLILAAHSLAALNKGPSWRKILMRTVAVLVVSAAVAAFGRFVWPKGLGTLTEQEKQRFVAALKAEAHPVPVHLMCPLSEEQDCAVASQFIQLFGMAGWTLSPPYVDRVTAGNPRQGLYFVLHSTTDPDYTKPEWRRPNVGVWTQLVRGYQPVKQAFHDIGTDASEEVGYTFPEQTIGIYFGVGTARR